mgnify:CR=1 FL=1
MRFIESKEEQNGTDWSKEAFKKSLFNLYNNRELCKKYGENGRKFVMENLTREIGTQKVNDKKAI